MINLIPQPKKIEISKLVLSLESLKYISLPDNGAFELLQSGVTLADEIEAITAQRLRFEKNKRPYSCCNCAEIGIYFEVKDGEKSSPDAYKMTINEQGIVISASAVSGLFYAIQTLQQLLVIYGAELPFLVLTDAPDFANRGFYHDVTRSKVPTFDTLCKLVDKLAYYKINQLQLYVEHTFAFKYHTDIWAGSDPLTAEEIIRLDKYCRERFVELVPSLSTFGHFYMILRSKRKEELNELEIKASELPFSFHDRMAHYTLDCQNEESIKLVREMIEEFSPLFSSKYFNICCDETFDLGKGRNKELAEKLGSSTKLYIDFLKKIINIVTEQGKVPMFWGDILIHDMSLIDELPSGTIALDWSYGAQPNCNFGGKNIPFYVCPGVTGWNRFLNHIAISSLNIPRLARMGLEQGAIGLLNTDWGDYGHVNPLSCSYFGMMHGAAASWNLDAAENIAAFDEAFERLELRGELFGEFSALWREVTDKSRTSWGEIQRFFDPSLRYNPSEMPQSNEELIEALGILEDAEAKFVVMLRKANPVDPLFATEFLTAFRGEILMHKVFLVMRHAGDVNVRKLADDMRNFEFKYAQIWHERNKPGEYFRFREIWLSICSYLDGEIAK